MMNFKQITPLDYPDLKRFFNHQKYRLCVYSLSSLLVWSNDVYQIYGATDGDILYVYAEYPSRPQDRHLILPISPSLEFSPDKLRDLAQDAGIQSYWFVPDHYIEACGISSVESYFTVRPQPHFDDYVYLTEDLAELKGNRYAKKRNLIHQFDRAYLSKNRVSVEKISPSVAGECLDFLKKWCESRDCHIERDEDFTCEKQAVSNTLENIDILGVEGLLVRVDGDVSAFVVAAYLTDDMGVMHFQKAYQHIRGLYQFLDNLCVRELFKGYTRLNKESDMNLPGLAQSKKSYWPVEKVRSFELVLR
ncbi:MAG: phosphatidylglycerol lysyltransferase domain-containing protein [Desulfobacterales bacterium]|nr:phosphatidylglycerol lysyltransferase domain-containing protein [Desulfobacterales bacterium]MDD4072632.1 phosphatidylglycerol lysyltransferase domain-containing protein [Desulfobacterales bacterium]MDD4391472.1 phosphatidylglycerol lysyltransferase domain-containing protein [Desulfobacterales bacterium]